MDFIALDVETANEDMGSICQIGLTEVIKGNIVSRHSFLINPEDNFSPINIAIHDIRPIDVKNAPTFKDYSNKLSELLTNKIVISHTHFDRVAMQKAAEKYGTGQIACTWLDSAKIVRRAWPEHFARYGYGLADVCSFLNYNFKHHDALEDAKAVAHIVLKASEHCGYANIKQWLDKVEKPIRNITDANNKINEDGNLFGETIVFTGALSITKAEAALLAAQAGCKVGAGVTKKTTIVVVGDKNINSLSGHNKSSKHRKAEALREKGVNIKIISESDFKKLVHIK